MKCNTQINNSAKQDSLDTPNSDLKRKLGLLSVIAIGVGVTIGTGIFSTMSEVAATAGSAVLLILAFVIGGLLQIPSNFVYAELSSAYPEDGGYYVYIRETGSKKLAFLTGWACFWAIDPPSLSIMALGLVNYLAVLLPFDDFVLRLISCFAILIFMAIHIRSVKGGGVIQVILTILKVLPFILIIGCGIFIIKGELFSSTVAVASEQSFIPQTWWISLLSAVAATTFAYDGMYAASYVSGEVKNPKKIMPMGLIITAVLISLLYFLLTTVSCGIVSVSDLASGGAPIALVASKLPLIGDYAGIIVAVMAVLVIIGSMSSAIMYQPRMGYAMAKDGYFFNLFSKVSKRYNSPYGAIVAHCVFAIILVLFFDIKELLIYFTFISLIKNFIAIYTIFILRKKKDYTPSYTCPFGLLFPIVSCGLNAILIVVSFIQYPIGCGLAVILVTVTGLLAFYFWDKRHKDHVR